MSNTWILIAGLLTCLTAIIAGFIAFGGSRSTRLPVERRTRPGTADPEGALAGPTRRLAQTLEAGIGTTRRAQLTAALDLAGITLGPGDFLLIVAAATLAAAAVGLVTVGPITAVLMALLPALIASVTLKFRTGRRRASFADQLEDSLQLLAGSLRTGHSLLRAMDAAAAESESPTSTEFRRVINETRIGRPLGAALDDVAIRMYSKDFAWITQAIAIHQEVGGDLAEVLDTVGTTIRERNQIRRQVKALSAEGKLSGIVLMILPFGVAAFLTLTNPAYLGKLTQTLPGWAMIVAALGLMVIGGLWLRKVVSFKF